MFRYPILTQAGWGVLKSIGESPLTLAGYPIEGRKRYVVVKELPLSEG